MRSRIMIVTNQRGKQGRKKQVSAEHETTGYLDQRKQESRPLRAGNDLDMMRPRPSVRGKKPSRANARSMIANKREGGWVKQ